jgi:hypothetical protein
MAAVIYNVTNKVEQSIAGEWLQWLKDEHIPDVLGTGCFTQATIVRLLEVDDSDGPTYAIQYQAGSKELYNRYIETFSTDRRNKAINKWGGRFIAFRSVMEVVH